MTDITETGSSGGGAAAASILLVDDEADILPEYQELLESHGFAALTESDPEAALCQVLASPTIAVVVTDLKMAKLHGADLIRAIRAQLPPGRSVAFIVLTGDATSGAAAQDLDAPILLKPVDFGAFIAAIRAALAGRP